MALKFPSYNEVLQEISVLLLAFIVCWLLFLLSSLSLSSSSSSLSSSSSSSMSSSSLSSSSSNECAFVGSKKVILRNFSENLAYRRSVLSPFCFIIVGDNVGVVSVVERKRVRRLRYEL